MHAILLMYRSLVLAVATPYNTSGSGSDGGGSDESGGGGDGFGEATVGVTTHTIKQIDHNLVLGGVKTQGAKNGGIGTRKENETEPPHNRPSMLSVEWAMAQALADEAAAEANKNDAFIAAASGNEKLGVETGGDGEGEACGTRLDDCAGVGKLNPGQSQAARDIATQLDTEVRSKLGVETTHGHGVERGLERCACTGSVVAVLASPLPGPILRRRSRRAGPPG